MYTFYLSSRRRHSRLQGDCSSDVCSSDLAPCASSYTDTARLDAADAPGAVAKQKDVPGEALDGEIFIDGTDEGLEIGRASCRVRVKRKVVNAIWKCDKTKCAERTRDEYRS